MKQLIMFFATIILLQSCMPKAQNKSLTYQNIVIVSDLSDRIEPTINRGFPNQQYPSKDIKEIHKILKFFKDECVKPGEKIGDKSCISFSTFSIASIACIDIGKIEDLGAKQQFINSTLKYQKIGLDYEIDIFKQKVQSAYDSIRNSGLDLISLLIEKISNEPIVKIDTYLTNGIDTTFLHYDNHVYIFTDGYLEYRNRSVNNQFYFGYQEIERVRQYIIANKLDPLKALESNKTLCLPAYYNKLNKYINLHILETHERDKNLTFQNYNHLIGQRDNEILEAVWRKWAKDSGFKNLTWDKF